MKFRTGQAVGTPAALEAIQAAGQTPQDFLHRHVRGDWGEVGKGDAAANDRAVRDGERILSVYKTKLDVTIWIVTEADRSATTILLPSEY